MSKNLEYLMKKNFIVEVLKIGDSEGGGFQARIPQLGSYAFVGDGDTIEEALKDLESVKRHLFKSYIEKGIPIPEPEEEDRKQCSGKFLLRLPTELHFFLSQAAKKNNTTLNQYCVYLLTRKAYLNSIEQEILGIRKDIKNVFSSIIDIRYRIETNRRIGSGATPVRWEINDYKKSA